MTSKNVLIYGAGSYARKVSKAFKKNAYNICGFVTSTPSPSRDHDGIPIFTIDNVGASIRSNCQLVCGIFNRAHPYSELAATASKHGFDNILWPWDFYPLLHDELGWCYWLDEAPKSLPEWQREKSYCELLTKLADEESQLTLNRTLAFRSGADLEFSSYHSADRQYFNELTLSALPSDRPISFLDLGAYNGDSLQLLRSHRQVGRALLLEPDPDNYQLLVQNLQKWVYDSLELQPIALPLGAGAEFGCFTMSGEGESSSIADGASNNNTSGPTVTVVPLDEAMPTACFDFIKIDVEGNDLAALKGMEGILKRSRAVLAVSLYHRPRDIIEMPLAIMALLSEFPYRYYIRQHMFNSFDTVFYAVPTERRGR
jgi:FkbM family methyltransferase